MKKICSPSTIPTWGLWHNLLSWLLILTCFLPSLFSDSNTSVKSSDGLEAPHNLDLCEVVCWFRLSSFTQLVVLHFISRITVKPRQCVLDRAQNLILQLYFEAVVCYRDIGRIISYLKLIQNILWSMVSLQNAVVVSRCATLLHLSQDFKKILRELFLQHTS